MTTHITPAELAAKCTCFRVENPWTYYGIVEPGGAMEPNPECQIHFPEYAHRLQHLAAVAERHPEIAQDELEIDDHKDRDEREIDE